jgi:alpha-amylase/alpha-mannosidase (GH57 family)
MKTRLTILSFVIILSFVLSACGQKPVEVGPTSPADMLYVNLLWHQHQPLYYKDADGVYTRPWVRVHATKDYYDMASTVQQYPDVHVTFNLTPVLIKQLTDFADNGAKDLYWTTAEVPADQLTDEQKRFILQRFFDANYTNIIGRFPRYQELLQMRGGSDTAAIDKAITVYSEQDYRDLQVWFNLAWFDPDFLGVEPLKALVDKGRDFTEADKKIVFTKAREVIKQVIPLHKKMQKSGQIEVITTPYAHPILPLIFDSKLALVGNPAGEAPERFSYPNDAIAHLEKSVEIYKKNFGQAPRGLWPGEGSVAQAVVPMIADAGYKWMATGEPVLAATLGIGEFTRDADETIQQADALYRPYYVTGSDGKQVAVFFRDWRMSDLVGFEYSQKDPDAAAADMMTRLENIRQQLIAEGSTGPNVVSIVLDGENAWEYYPNDGKAFLNALYKAFSESSTIRTVTPSEYLAMFPEQKTLENLFPGAWFSPNYDTWIGEPEETQAWTYLEKVRSFLAAYDISKKKTAPSAKALEEAKDFMYLAEGSDWFWWYGADQDSGQDAYFDIGFRALLSGVYTSLGVEVPAFVNVPIIPKAPAAPAAQFKGVATATIDGMESTGEWANAATYPAGEREPLSGMAYLMDKEYLYIKGDLSAPLAAGDTLGIYLKLPRATTLYPFTNGESPVLFGFAASHLFEIGSDGKVATYTAAVDGWTSSTAAGEAAIGDDVVEIAIPLSSLGEWDSGDDIRMAVVAQPIGEVVPLDGPAQIIIPDLGLSTVILSIEDPQGDDNGPGTYTYPTDPVMVKQAFDIKNFTVAYDDRNVIFKFTMFGDIPNPWGSGVNLSLQSFDVYIDKDPGAGTGARLMLPGRNAALASGDGWDVAVWAEGWTPEILAPDPTTLEPKQISGSSFKIIVDSAAKLVTLRVPRTIFGDGDPATWGYVATVASQDGYPSTGVWRLRDVLEQNAQWKFGGAKADSNHTRIIDLAWAEVSPTQADILGTYTSNTKNVGDLTADDFAQVPLILAK